MRYGVVLLAFALAGCQTTPADEALVKQSVPKDYRAQVLQALRDNLRDPYSVRDAEITGPVALYVGLGAGVNGSSRGPGVCLRYNAKNGYGGYVGRQLNAAWFSASGVVLMTPMFNSCRGATWTTFNELEAL